MRVTLGMVFGLIFILVGVAHLTKGFAPIEALLVRVGFMVNPRTIRTDILSVQRNGENKTMTVALTNTTQEPIHYFRLDCKAVGRSFTIVDRSGIRPDRQDDVRAYTLPDLAIAEVKGCKTEAWERGKPMRWFDGQIATDKTGDRIEITDAESPEDME